MADVFTVLAVETRNQIFFYPFMALSFVFLCYGLGVRYFSQYAIKVKREGTLLDVTNQRSQFVRCDLLKL